MKPRDFHIGTEVKCVTPSGSYADYGPVLFYDPQSNLVYFRSDPGRPFERDKSEIQHASDGAPLGEWVPLPISAFLQLQEYTAEDAQEQANDFIRGDAEQ